MRRTLAASAVLIASSAAVLAPPASARRISAGHETSWGKADVSIEQYWTDASQCGHQAADLDLTDSNPARALVLASRMIDNQTGYDDVERALRLAAPDIQWARAATLMRHELDSCLMARGYVKFRLTKGQARHLRTLETGSLERRRYLHSLASDPHVLAEQAITDA